MKNSVLFHLVPVCCGDEEVKISASATHVSPSARGDDGLEIGFHRAIDQSLKNKVHHEDDGECATIAVLRLHDELDLRGFSRRDCPGAYIKVMLNDQEECVSLRLIADNTARHGTANNLFSWKSMSRHESQAFTLCDDGVRDYRLGDDATIWVGVLTLKLVWVQPNPQPGEEPWCALLRKARFELAQRTERDTIVHSCEGSVLKTVAATSKVTYGTIAKHNILPAPKVSIGKGGVHTHVYMKETNLPHKQFIAVKEVRGSKDEREAALNEIAELRRLGRNKHIVTYFGCYEPDQEAEPGAPVEIYLDLYDGDVGSLHKGRCFKNPSTAHFGLELHDQMLYHMLLALKYLSGWNVCHRDIKPKNTLYKYFDQKYHFVLSDFGLSRAVRKGNTEVGTNPYMAPEVYDVARDASPAMDIWSLAVTLMEVHPRIPFELNMPSYNSKAVRPKIAEFGRAFPEYQPMIPEEPQMRASAECLLLQLFKPRGWPTRVSARTLTMKNGRRSRRPRFLQ